MKKLLMCLAIAYMAFACSSDDGETPPKERTQYEVNFTISDADLRAEIAKQDSEKKQICLLDGDKLGNEGLFVYEYRGVRVDAYDACCPVHWGDDTKKIKLEFRPEFGSAYCPECRSSFDLTNGKGTASYGLAHDKNMNLVKYDIERPIIEGVYSTVFSNPKFVK